jgi:inorganic pyrophosphatase
VLDEIAHFFDVYKQLEPDKGTETSDWEGREKAERAIVEAQERYGSKETDEA